MSDQVPEPNAPAATPAPEGAAPNPLHDAARAKASRRAGRRGAAPEAPAEPAPQAAPATAPQAAPEAGDEASAVDVNDLKTKHARAVNQARQYERKYRELETKVRQLEESSNKTNPLESDDFEAKVKYAAKHGITLKALADYTLQRRGDAQPDSPQSNPEIEKLRAELEELKTSRQKADGERQAREAQSVREQELDVIDRHAKTNGKWSLISEFGRQQMVYDRFYEIAQKQGFAPRLPDVMDEVAEQITTGTKALLRHGKVRELAKADPELFEELREFFREGESQSQSGNQSQPDETAERRSRGGQRNGARPITPADASQKTSRRERGLPSKAERKRAAVARLTAMRSD